MMSFEQFIIAASGNANNSPQRIGQSFMQSLQFHHPALYDDILNRVGMAWDANPMYDDSKFPNFLAFIAERWIDEGQLKRKYDERSYCD